MLDGMCWIDRFADINLFIQHSSKLHPTFIQHDRKMLDRFNLGLTALSKSLYGAKLGCFFYA